jgi:hypothetical protein
MATLYADGVYENTGLHQRRNTREVTPRFGQVDAVYTMTGDEAAADVVRLARLHQGDRVIPQLSFATSDGIAGTATIDVGDTGTVSVANATLQAADGDRYADGLDVAASGSDLFTATGTPVTLVPQFTLEGDTWLTVTFATLATPVAGKKLRIVATYSGA